MRSTRSVASRPPTTARGIVGGDGSGHGGQRTITPRPRRHPFHPPEKAVATRARGVHRGARRAAHGSCATSPRARSRRTPRRGTATTTSRWTSCAAWATSGCSASRSPRSTAAAAATSRCSASRSRSWPGSTTRWRSPSRRGWGSGANPIHRFGTEAQKQTWLPDLCAGRTLGGFGLTEPEAGSDAGGTRTTAVARRGGGGVGDQRREGVHHQLGHRASPRSSPSRPAPARARSARSSCRPAPRASRCSRPTGRWAGTRRTPTGSPSPTPACRRPTCSASGAAGSPSSSRSSTRGASPSPRWRSAACRRASSTAPGTPRTATPSAGRSAPTRAWPSRWPTWP